MSIASQGVMFGSHTTRGTAGYETLTNRKQEIVHRFRKMGVRTPLSSSGLVTDSAAQIVADSTKGRVEMLTLEACYEDLALSRDYHPSAIWVGKLDAYFIEWADYLAAHPTDIYLRMFHEFNADWYGWGSDPECFIKAWRHLVNLFRDRGATNVKWVWCANGSDIPASNDMEKYWPGSEYVDVLSFDQYNAYGGWKPFSTLIQSPYDRVTALDPNLPVWIGETGCPEGNASISGWTAAGSPTKASWYTDMFAAEGFPRIKAIVMFDTQGGFNWRIDTSTAALNAFKTGLANSAGYLPVPT